MSGVTYHVSCVSCPVSGVRCKVLGVIFFFDKAVKLVGGGSVFNGAYPV